MASYSQPLCYLSSSPYYNTNYKLVRLSIDEGRELVKLIKNFRPGDLIEEVLYYNHTDPSSNTHLGTQLRQGVDGAAGVQEVAPVLLAGQAVVHEGKDIWHEVGEDEAVTLTLCCQWLLLLDRW